MSTNAPLLGSKISLISKSEIRYEGVLYAIDTKEATLALAKVKSFGTEDRPTDRPVSRRDEVYEYIIFRASDIKDLHVCEPPKPQPIVSGLPADPAIVQHSGSVSAQYSIPFSQSYVCGMAPFQHFPTHSHIPSYYPSSHMSGSTRSTTQTSQRKSPTNDAGVQVSVTIDSDTNLSAENSQEQIKQRPAREQRDNVQMQSVMQSQQHNLSNRRGGQGRRRGGPRRGWGRGRGGSNYTRDVLKFDNEYDFEQANAEFQELETKLAKAKLDEPEPVSEPMANGDVEELVGAYDRKKSFFDDISCDSSQRSKGLPRFDWRVERRLNVETFGVSTSNSWFRRRRGRGNFRRGYRSRGGMMRSQPETQKTVTFDDKPTIKEVEVIEAVEVLDVAESNSKPEQIPVIELVVEKEKTDWPEGSKTDPVWN